MSSDSPVLSCRDIRKTFRIYRRPVDRLTELASLGSMRRHREFEALSGVSFEVARGESVALLGTNGSGKSTLLQIVAGTMTPTRGRIEVEGTLAALLQLGAGFIGEVTARENAILAARLYGMEEREAMERLPWIAEFAELGDHLDTPVKFFSSGMYARLAFAVAVAVTPDAILVDEALSVGDAAFQRKAESYLRNELGHAAKVIVTHDLEAAKRHCSRAIVLDRGTVVHDGGVEDAIAMLTGADPGVARKLSPRSRGAGDIEIAIEALGFSTGAAISPGDSVTIDVTVRSTLPYAIPCILGHFWTDAAGRELFGSSNETSGAPPIEATPVARTHRITFPWPQVPPGQYRLNLAALSLDSTTGDRLTQARLEDVSWLGCDWRWPWQTLVGTPSSFSSTDSPNER